MRETARKVALVMLILSLPAWGTDEQSGKDNKLAYAHAQCAAMAWEQTCMGLPCNENAEIAKRAEASRRAHLRAGYALYRKAVPGGAITGQAEIGASEQEGSAFSYGEFYGLYKNVVQSDIRDAISHVTERRSEAWRAHAGSLYRRANCSLLLTAPAQ